MWGYWDTRFKIQYKVENAKHKIHIKIHITYKVHFCGKCVHVGKIGKGLYVCKETERQKERERDRQTDRQTDRQ